MKHPFLLAMAGLTTLVSASPPCPTGPSLTVQLDPPKRFQAKYRDDVVYRIYQMQAMRTAGETLVFEGGIDPASLVTPKMLKHWTPSYKHRRAELLLTGMLFGECRGQDLKCAYAAGHTALNRAALNLDRLYGIGLWGVLNKHAAYSCLLKSDPNYKKIRLAMAGKLNPHSPDGIKWTLLLGVSHDLMHHKLKDPTHGATLYVAATMKHRPTWTHGFCVKQETAIGGHIFFRQYPIKVIHTGFLHLGKKKIVCDYDV